MRWRPGHLAFVLFQIVWLNVVVPGHTRGTITLGGASCSDAACQPAPIRCCASRAQERPTPAQKHACAICFYAAHLSAPPAIDCTLPPLHLLHAIRHETAEARVARDVILPFHSRGPPARDLTLI